MGLQKVGEVARLTSLKSLDILNCARLRGWDCTLVEQVGRRSCRSEDTNVLDVDVLDSHMESKLEKLELDNCGLSDLRSIGGFSKLERLEIKALPVTELPDVSSFPRLKYLTIRDCDGVTLLRSSGLFTALIDLNVKSCTTLTAVPDLAMFPALEELHLIKCNKLKEVSNSGPLAALTISEVYLCNTLTTVPNLAMFLGLKGRFDVAI